MNEPREPLSNDPAKPMGLKAKLDVIDDHSVSVVTIDEQHLRLPRNLFPSDAAVGDTVWLVPETHATREEAQRANARALLNEILNPEP